MADHSAPPPWRRLAEDLRGQIISGKYPPGGRLPSAVTLHQETGLAVLTCRKALRWLADEGLAVMIQGMGTYVAPGPGELPPARAARRIAGSHHQTTTANCDCRHPSPVITGCLPLPA